MGLGIKNFNILGVYWKIQLWGGSSRFDGGSYHGTTILLCTKLVIKTVSTNFLKIIFEQIIAFNLFHF